jgi:hypothetical protein
MKRSDALRQAEEIAIIGYRDPGTIPEKIVALAEAGGAKWEAEELEVRVAYRGDGSHLACGYHRLTTEQLEAVARWWAQGSKMRSLHDEFKDLDCGQDSPFTRLMLALRKALKAREVKP